MGEVTLFPNKANKAMHLRMLLTGLAFTACGVCMVSLGAWVGHVVYLFSGLGSAISVMVLLRPSASYLKLRDDEFEFGRVFRKYCVKWEDVENFEIWTASHQHGSTEQVGWNYKEGVEVSKFVRLNRNVGIDDCLADTYGMETDELLSLMNEHLANHRDKRSRFR